MRLKPDEWLADSTVGKPNKNWLGRELKSKLMSLLNPTTARYSGTDEGY